MQPQPTLTELKRRCAEAFTEAHAAIDATRRIAHQCNELNADLRRTRDDYIAQKRRFLKLGDHS